MLNSYYLGGNTNNQKCIVNLNTPSSGFIQKSNPMSRFIRFQRGSEIEELLFPTETDKAPRLYREVTERYASSRPLGYDEYTRKVYEEVTVLQVCIFGNDYMLAEYVFNKDLEPDKVVVKNQL